MPNIQDPKNPGNGKPRNPHWEVPLKDSERSGGGCARRSSVIDHHLQDESLLGSKSNSTRQEMERDLWGDMQKVTRSLRANLENSSKSWATFRVWNRSLDRFSGIENFREISWKFVDAPRTPRGMQITLLHAKSVANEFAVTSKQQDISPLLMELTHKGIRAVKTPRIFENFWFPIPGFLVSRVFWFLKYDWTTGVPDNGNE